MLQHSGMVTAVFSDRVTVMVEHDSSCDACNIRNACRMTRPEYNEVLVYTERAGLYSVGDRVFLKESKRMGANAVLIAFGIPLFIVIFALVFTVVCSCSELLAISVSIGLLATYYLALYFLKRFVAFTVNFEIE